MSHIRYFYRSNYFLWLITESDVNYLNFFVDDENVTKIILV